MKRQSHVKNLTALSLLLPLTAVASPAAFESGFYYGAKIGAQQPLASWEQSSSVQFFDVPLGSSGSLTNLDQHGQDFTTNFMGNLGVGYAFVINRFFLAAELSVNLATEQELNWTENQANIIETIFLGSDIQSTNLEIETEVELENPDLIFDLRPGWLLAKNFLLYGRAGVAYNKLSIEQNALLTLTDAAGFLGQSPMSSSDSDDAWAWRVGIGMEYKVTQNLALNMDYVFSDYGNIDTTTSYLDDHIGPPDDPFASLTDISTKADVTKNTATVGFNWYFGGKKQTAYRGPDK